MTFSAIKNIKQEGGGREPKISNVWFYINLLKQEILTRAQAHSKHYCAFQGNKYSLKIPTNANDINLYIPYQAKTKYAFILESVSL